MSAPLVVAVAAVAAVADATNPRFERCLPPLKGGEHFEEIVRTFAYARKHPLTLRKSAVGVVLSTL